MALFVIRESGTGTYCTSSRHRKFSSELDEAATFVSEKNALKAIREMLKGKGVYAVWSADGKEYTHDSKAEYISILRGNGASWAEYADDCEKNLVERPMVLEVTPVRLVRV